ncbi:hypothetical protein SAMN05444166_4309 [Singulisphaera sp. GP187]|uniref:hypothetical protein n=1 Tax=Singulisphaera sp. GP187 TaxID=1882752 RepID=UPI000925AF3C|nr:hypothetical protein [Singulisphaera sp. GP187]SIO38996.1 hypothetical protein SAMN05444166_4309 [Singulisphaera sp. GP187]
MLKSSRPRELMSRTDTPVNPRLTLPERDQELLAACGDGTAIARAQRAAEARAASTRRRGTDPTTCDPDYSPEELEFILAIQQYKQTSGRKFPTWREVLEVLLSLGYERAR